MNLRRQLLSPLRLPSKLNRAYLAEEYDGIGQYAKVQLSRTSSSGGMLARVASGDFNIGRKFPSGTPVVVFSSRGKLEILSLGGKLVQELICSLFDSFSRTLSSGLGTADGSEANVWTLVYDSARSISGVDVNYGRVGVQNGVFPNTQGATNYRIPFPSSIDGNYEIQIRGYFVGTPEPPNGAAASYFYYVDLPDGRSWDIDIATYLPNPDVTSLILELLDKDFNTITEEQLDGAGALGLQPNVWFLIDFKVTQTTIRCKFSIESTGVIIFDRMISSEGSGSLIGTGQYLGISAAVISNDANKLFAIYTDSITFCWTR